MSIRRWRMNGGRHFPMERRPISLVCACSTLPFSGSDREGRSVWLVAPWGHGSRCWACLLRGTCSRCGGESTDQTSISVVTDEAPTVGWKLLEQGPESRSASGMCSGGVSAVIGSSGLDAHTLVRDEANGNQLSCSLLCWGGTSHRGSGVPLQVQAASQCKANQRVPGAGSVRSTLWR